jgi:2'-5' RNA ligase
VTRAFVAIRPPESVLDAIAARTARLEIPNVRLAPREQWHITVQFLGNDVDVDAVTSALQGLTTPPGQVALNVAGPLGQPRRSVVFCIELLEGSEWMTGLAAEVAARLELLGFPPEHRTFRPHLTLARYKKPTPMTDAIEVVGPLPIGEPWVVDRVVVFESRLRHGQPADHLVRSVVPLAGV